MTLKIVCIKVLKITEFKYYDRQNLMILKENSDVLHTTLHWIIKKKKMKWKILNTAKMHNWAEIAIL